jgi:hypothetical protein
MIFEKIKVFDHMVTCVKKMWSSGLVLDFVSDNGSLLSRGSVERKTRSRLDFKMVVEAVGHENAHLLLRFS